MSFDLVDGDMAVEDSLKLFAILTWSVYLVGSAVASLNRDRRSEPIGGLPSIMA